MGPANTQNHCSVKVPAVTRASHRALGQPFPQRGRRSQVVSINLSESEGVCHVLENTAATRQEKKDVSQWGGHCAWSSMRALGWLLLASRGEATPPTPPPLARCREDIFLPWKQALEIREVAKQAVPCQELRNVSEKVCKPAGSRGSSFVPSPAFLEEWGQEGS